MTRGEFVALVAMMFATVAFSMDALLPALPDIAAELSPAEPNRAALVLTTFFFGLGVGTFFAGPLSDAFGRKRVMLLGCLLYIVAAAVAWASATLEIMLIARAFQGLGAAGPRIVAMAVTRDLFAGRDMARIVSFIMIVFALVPGFAPAMAVGIIHLVGWRGIYAAFILFSAVTVIWMLIRLPETLPMEDRRPMRLRLMAGAVGEMFRHPTVRLSIVVQTFCMATLIAVLMLVQPIFEGVYDRGASFAYWFGAIALVSASASWLNAVLVMRLGMRRLVTLALGAQVVICVSVLAFGPFALAEPWGFGFFALWQVTIFLQTGLTLGNLNAIAMEPMGHIAGMAASIISGISTVLAALIASQVVVFFDGSVMPLVIFVLAMAGMGFVLMLGMGRVEARLQGVEAR